MDTVLRGCQGNLLPDDGAKVSYIVAANEEYLTNRGK